MRDEGKPHVFHSNAYPGCGFCGGKGCLACEQQRKKAEREAAWNQPAMRDDGTPAEQPRRYYMRIVDAGKIAECARCKAPVKVAAERRKDAEILRLSTTTKGVCANCAVTEFLYNTYPPNSIIDEAGPEMLLKPGVGEAFVSSGLMDHADMDIREVNWQKVVDNWYLPVTIAKKNPLNPYTMGESLRSHLRRKDTCKCPASDAWRCARARNVAGRIACECECHKYPWGPPAAEQMNTMKESIAESFGGTAADWDIELRGGSLVVKKRGEKPQ